MTAQALLVELRRRGVRLRVTGDMLRYAPKRAVEPDLLPELRRHKSTLIRLLAVPIGFQDRSHDLRPAPDGFVYSGDLMRYGDICAGWTPRDWATELRRKARCCRDIRPDVADYYESWAADIEERLRRIFP